MASHLRKTAIMFMCGVLTTLVIATVGSSADVRASADKTSDGYRIEYVSHKTVYVEEFANSRLVGRYWSADGRVNPKRFWDSDAFEFRIKDRPSPPRVTGTQVSAGWEWVAFSELPKQRPGCRDFAVDLTNKLYPVRLRVHTLLDGTPVLARWLEITNTSKKPFALTSCYPWSGRLWDKDAPMTVGHSLRWKVLWEGWFGWTPIEDGLNVVMNDHGMAHNDPFFIVRNESNGEHFFGQLAWPANYRIELNKNNGLSFRAGPTAVNALRVIGPGETLATPAVHLGYIKGDFDASVQAIHEHIRREVLPKRDPKRSFLAQDLANEDYITTCYHGDDYNEENIKKLLDVAAAAGLDLFIVDGPTWAESYGDWVPKAKWFPRGLGPVAEYAHRKGLLLGIYAEPEGGRGDWSKCATYNEHPEWFVAIPGDQGRPGGPLLNLSIPAAADWMESELCGIVDRCHVDLYRHDQNAFACDQGSETLRDGFVENDYWRHYDAFYKITEDMHKKYPELILHQASGSGARLDLATLSRWYESYSSDRCNYPFVYRMMSGLSAYLPPEILVIPNGMYGVAPDMITTLRGAFTLGNTPMIHNSMMAKSFEEFKPDLREEFVHYTTLYKSFIRPMLPTLKVWHHSPVNATGGVESSDWFVMEFTSPDHKKGWATIIRLSDVGEDIYLLKPRGLNARKNYSVTFDNEGRTETIDGSSLMTKGLSVRLPGEPHSELLLFQAK